MRMVWIVILALAALAIIPAHAQTKPSGGSDPADTMRTLREQLQVDKKKVVAANLPLTQAEAKGFWPIYEDYQKALHQINDRLATMLVSYAKEHNAASMTDDKALALLDRYLGTEEEEVKLKRAFVPRLAKVLPGRKVARYMQIENKIRAIVKYEISGEVPLAK